MFRIDAGGRRYVLRVEGTPSPLRNPHQYQSMRIASEAGIAPRLYYADEDSRVAVIDYVEAQPLGSFAGGPLRAAQALGELRRRLEATPVFPYFVDYPAIVARLWAHVCRTGLFAPGVLDPVNERLAAIREAYVWDRAHSVSCHNDPVPANILYDGKRLWLIDWESAYCNDPLVDVAIMSDHLARTPELQATLLQAWLGRAPDEALLARLELVARADPPLLCRRLLQRLRARAARGARYRSLGADAVRTRAGRSRRTAQVRHACTPSTSSARCSSRRSSRAVPTPRF